MKKIDHEMISTAVGALEHACIVKDLNYNQVFGSYISSLGAAIVQSGLLPAMIFYENEDSAAKQRHKVIVAIKEIINKQRSEGQRISGSIAKYILNHPEDKELLSEVTHAAIALKLALRMFTKIKGNDYEE